MTMDENKHRRNAETFLDHADDMVEQADHLQASEKIWGTVAHTLKEIADRHGWKDESNTDLSNIAGYLAVIADDEEITRGFRDARAFHANFYEDEFELDQIAQGVRGAEETVKRLRKAEEEFDGGARPSNGASSPFMYYAQQRRDDMHASMDAMREQGLSSYDATTAARIINAARRGDVDALSFKVGPSKRKVTLGGDGRPKVGRAAPGKAQQPRTYTAAELRAAIQQPVPPSLTQKHREPPYWPRRR